jgi:hypothetical protein
MEPANRPVLYEPERFFVLTLFNSYFSVTLAQLKKAQPKSLCMLSFTRSHGGGGGGGASRIGWRHILFRKQGGWPRRITTREQAEDVVSPPASPATMRPCQFFGEQ